MKYYAVARGRVSGIFNTWQECKNQVHGFSGAIFKSFKSLEDAKAFIQSHTGEPTTTKLLQSNNDSKPSQKQPSQLLSSVIQRDHPSKVNIYTDGSHFKQGDYIGYGAFCRLDKTEYRLSGHINEALLKRYDIKTTKVSNPTAEFIAFNEVIHLLAPIGSTTTLVFYIDYYGVEKWMKGYWQTKQPYIRRIKTLASQKISQSKLKVEYRHVSGHSGDYGNDEADKMAKCQRQINEFGSYFN